MFDEIARSRWIVDVDVDSSTLRRPDEDDVHDDGADAPDGRSTMDHDDRPPLRTAGSPMSR